MKVLATPRSFGKNNPELFDILRDAGLDVVRNDTGGILSAAQMCEKLAARFQSSWSVWRSSTM